MAQAASSGKSEETAHEEKYSDAGSLEKFIEFQNFLESAQDPDWLLTIAGMAIAFWGAQNLIRTVIEIPTTAIPAGIRLYKVKQAQKLGEKTLVEIRERVPSLEKMGVKAKTAKDLLVEHMGKIPDKEFKRKFLDGKLGEIVQLLSNEGIRTRISANKKGSEWLARYDEYLGLHDSAMEGLIKEFNETSAKLSHFSAEQNKLAEGLLYMEGLRHKPISFRAEPSSTSEPGSMVIYKDSGFNEKVTDPRNAHVESHAMATACERMMSQLTNEGVKAGVALKISSALKPLAHVGIVAAGYGLYQLGAHGIRNSHQVDPEELLEQSRQRERLETMKNVAKSQELTSLSEQLQRERNADKSPKLSQSYAILRSALREHMPKLASDVRYRTNYQTRDAADFDGRMKRFSEDDVFANSIIDSALAEAALSEVRVSDTSGLADLLTSNDPAKEAILSRLLMKQFAFSAKYLWPTLSIEGSSHPVEASTVAEIVSDVVPKLKKLATPPPTASGSGETPSHTPKNPSVGSTGELPKPNASVQVSPSEQNLVVSNSP